MAGKDSKRILAILKASEIRRRFPKQCIVIDEERKIFGSCQPTREEFVELIRYGFKTIVNLRCKHSDAAIIRGLDIEEQSAPCHAFGYEELQSALKMIKNFATGDGAVLVHDCRGIDRVGAIAVAWHIVYGGADPKKLIDMYDSPRQDSDDEEDNDFDNISAVFGRAKRRFIYRGLSDKLRGTDWVRMRRELGCTGSFKEKLQGKLSSVRSYLFSLFDKGEEKQ
ncbi:MAG: hypothetical protein MJ025_00880 [Victivallaceae bacterium]|nr:hypothetical protein [Victivallaceae bacterium]